jgi:hypothetical protein
VQSVASLIAPPLVSLTYAHFIEAGRAVQVPGSAFYLAGALMLAGMLTAWRATRGPVAPAATIPV